MIVHSSNRIPFRYLCDPSHATQLHRLCELCTESTSNPSAKADLSKLCKYVVAWAFEDEILGPSFGREIVESEDKGRLRQALVVIALEHDWIDLYDALVELGNKPLSLEVFRLMGEALAVEPHPHHPMRLRSAISNR